MQLCQNTECLKQGTTESHGLRKWGIHKGYRPLSLFMFHLGVKLYSPGQAVSL